MNEEADIKSPPSLILFEHNLTHFFYQIQILLLPDFVEKEIYVKLES